MSRKAGRIKTPARRAARNASDRRRRARLAAAGLLPPLTAERLFHIEQNKALKAGMSPEEAKAVGLAAKATFIRDRSAAL